MTINNVLKSHGLYIEPDSICYRLKEIPNTDEFSKDPAKIREKIDTARSDFESRKSAAALAASEAESVQFQQYRDRAALSALTGRVLAIGWQAGEKYDVFELAKFPSEREMIAAFFDFVCERLVRDITFVGHNILKFDMPFLIRRAWALGLDVSAVLRFDILQYHPNFFIDTMKIWGDNIKLDTLAGFFGTTRKNGHGANFHRLYFGSEEERAQALEYLQNDVRMTCDVARRMGVIL